MAWISRDASSVLRKLDATARALRLLVDTTVLQSERVMLASIVAVEDVTASMIDEEEAAGTTTAEADIVAETAMVTVMAALIATVAMEGATAGATEGVTEEAIVESAAIATVSTVAEADVVPPIDMLLLRAMLVHAMTAMVALRVMMIAIVELILPAMPLLPTRTADLPHLARSMTVATIDE